MSYDSLTGEAMTRLSCARCGFDGYMNPTVGHICMRMITLDEYERLQSLEQELERTNARYEALLANFKGRCLYCVSCDNRQACFDNMGCMNVPIACGMSKLEPARRTSGDERG